MERDLRGTSLVCSFGVVPKISSFDQWPSVMYGYGSWVMYGLADRHLDLER